MITTTLLAATAHVWIAPAMNVHMYDHPAVKKNISILSSYNYQFIEPSEGYLACGYVGKGRLEEPEKIVELIKQHFSNKSSLKLKGKTVLITAGPTREKIDPVRFITNHSTGKMGYALAEAAKNEGAKVLLISGPVHLSPPPGIDLVKVESADDMYQAVMNNYEAADIIIKTAAVADYTPKVSYDHKMKKQPGDKVIELARTKDILSELGTLKSNKILVGFAAETENVEEYALKKLKAKNADMIVANNVKSEGAGFGMDTNIVTLFMRNGSKIELPLMSKLDVAYRIIEAITVLPKDLEPNESC
jgi:phosphopantothenoylcysteine decarboxylase/phosphopantothenate--cysteine ligase